MSTLASAARSDFRRARRKAFWRAIASWIKRDSNELLAFEEIRRQLHVDAQHDSGIRQVPLDQIVGSVGRYRDFDRAFLPRQIRTRARWESVDSAQHQGVSLPPVELYKLGATYFVKDGNHRVSVAREHGQAFIDARVIEVSSATPIDSIEDLLELIHRDDAVAFHTATRIAQRRPGARIELTLPGQYEKLLEHIGAHRWFLGIEHKHEVPYGEAVTSWYDRVYLPTVEAIRRTDALRDFPHRTEGDLYLWITEHQWYLQQAGVAKVAKGRSLDPVVADYAEEHTERRLKRLSRVVRRPTKRAR